MIRNDSKTRRASTQKDSSNPMASSTLVFLTPARSYSGLGEGRGECGPSKGELVY